MAKHGRSRGTYADPETWARLLRVAPRHEGGRHAGKPSASAFLTRAVGAAERAALHCGGRDPWDWIGEAIEQRAAIPPGGIALAVDLERMSLSDRARLQPDETRVRIAAAWIAAAGNRALAIDILRADAAQWIRALHYLPGLSNALRQFCPAVK